MSTRTPRSPIFKKKVALEALREGQTVSQIASKYSVHPMQVSQWRKSLVDGAESIFSGKSQKERPEKEIEALERKIGQLTMDNDYLKKKLGC